MEVIADLDAGTNRRAGKPVFFALLGLLGAVVFVVALLAVTALTGGSGRSSVGVAARSAGAEAPRDAPAAPAKDTVAECIARETLPAIGAGNGAPLPAGMMAIYDQGKQQTVLMRVSDYCTSVVALTPVRQSGDLSTVQIYLENGEIKGRPGLPISTDPKDLAPTAPTSK